MTVTACPICAGRYGPDVICLGTDTRARADRRAARLNSMALHPASGRAPDPLAPEPPHPPTAKPRP